MSKFPIVTTKTHQLSLGDRRVALQADVEINGDTLHVFTTHLIHAHQKDSPVQNSQADKLVECLTDKKTVLTGDFNALPNSYPIGKISRVLVNTNNEEVPTFSLYPEGCCPDKMKHRLDYIFVSPDIKMLDFTFGKSKGSDHLPVIATIEI